MSSVPAKEQRRSQRIRHELMVELRDKQGARTVQSLDVARHGLFLATGGAPPRERHLVQLTVHLPDGPIKAAASVTRTLKNDANSDGVGVQFFALSDDDKRRWDGFIFDLQRSTSSNAPQSQSSRGHETSSAGATFLVKLKTIDRLKDFAANHLASGGTMLFTPVLRGPGEVITLVVVHPFSDEEFRLPGVIHKMHEDQPKRLEIYFHGVTPALLRSFSDYVETGRPPLVQLDPPLQSPRERVPASDLDLDVDVDVFAEDTIDADGSVWRSEAGALPLRNERLAREAAAAAARGPPITPGDPGLRPATYLVRCHRSGNGCASEPYAIDLGPCRGVLGLVADHAAFLSNKTGRIVTSLRLASPEQQQARTTGIVVAGAGLDVGIDVATLLRATALAAPARDPSSGALLKTTRAIERLERVAHALQAGAPPAITKVACVECKLGRLTIERT